MPKNKDALVRYRIINRCLIDFRYVTMEKLMDVFFETFDHEVRLRTIEKDIHDMRYDNELGYYAPIRYDRQRRAYFYDDLDYSIDKIALDYNDLKALTFASALLDQYKSIGIFSTFSGAVQKIINTMKINRLLKDYPDKACVGFENMPVIKGQEHLSPILDAILGKKALRIEHRRFDAGEVRTHIVHPFYLKEFRSRWYLVGYQLENRRIQSFGTERILSLSVLPDTPFTGTAFDPESYYRHAVGVIVSDEPPAEITLRFTARQGMYVLTQPVHESQVVVSQDKESIVVRLTLVPAYEFISMILGWGADVEVLEPAWLREKIRGMIREMLGVYDSGRRA